MDKVEEENKKLKEEISILKEKLELAILALETISQFGSPNAKTALERIK